MLRPSNEEVTEQYGTWIPLQILDELAAGAEVVEMRHHQRGPDERDEREYMAHPGRAGAIPSRIHVTD